MGKLSARLNKQLKNKENRQDAGEALRIYEYLKETNDGRVWESQWTPLVKVRYEGKYPYVYIYSLTPLGKTVLRGLEK